MHHQDEEGRVSVYASKGKAATALDVSITSINRWLRVKQESWWVGDGPPPAAPSSSSYSSAESEEDVGG